MSRTNSREDLTVTIRTTRKHRQRMIALGALIAVVLLAPSPLEALPPDNPICRHIHFC